MIKIKVNQDGYIKDLHVSGHADYDEHGKDIVCAAVSSMTILTINAIEKFGLDQIVDLTHHDEGLIDLKVLSQDDTIETLLRNLIDNLEVLASDYQNYIRIEK
jgi:uncharacterized protein YsxB (DUF464 family)